MKIKLMKIDGSDTGKQATLKPDVFKIEADRYSVYQSVRQYMANQRQGTHASKGRSDVSGGGKKPFRQKGTGNARQGTIRAPHMPGGGKVFGPQPRDYGFKLNRKYSKLARKSALSIKAENKELIVVEDFALEAPKTRAVVDILNNLQLSGQKVLFLTAENDPVLHKSVRNIPYVNSLEARNVSVYDLLNSHKVVIQKSAIKVIQEVLA